MSSLLKIQFVQESLTHLHQLLLELLGLHQRQAVAQTGDLPQDRVVAWELAALHILEVLEEDADTHVKHADGVLLGREV